MKNAMKWVVLALLMTMPGLSWGQGGVLYTQVDNLISSNQMQPQAMFSALYAENAASLALAVPPSPGYDYHIWRVLQDRYGFSDAEASQMTDDVTAGNSSEFVKLWRARYPLQNPAVKTIQTNVYQSAIFTKMEPTRKAAAGKGMPTIVGADITLNQWKYENGGKGWTAGINPGITVGENSQFSLNMPLYQTDVWRNPKEILTYGLDGKFKQKINDNMALGMHANFLQDYYGTSSTDKREGSFSLGPFTSFTVPMGERVNLSFGGMLDYTDPEWSQEVWTGSLGANLGIKILDNLVTNPYFVYSRDLSRAQDGVDNDSWDVGIELKALLGETWSFTVGTKSTMGYVGYKSYEYYIGTTRQW